MKGGVGKSIISANLAAGLGRIGSKVLLINTDGQNNSLSALKKPLEFNGGFDIRLDDPNADLSKVTVNLIEIGGGSVDGIPSFRILEINNVLTSNQDNLEGCFNSLFPPEFLSKYDYVVFDCGPSESQINSMLIKMAGGIIMPVQTQVASLEGISLAMNYITSLGRPATELIKLIVPNMMRNNNESKGAFTAIQNLFPEDKITKPIPDRTIISVAAGYGINIFDYTTNKDVIFPFLNLLEKTLAVFR